MSQNHCFLTFREGATAAAKLGPHLSTKHGLGDVQAAIITSSTRLPPLALSLTPHLFPVRFDDPERERPSYAHRVPPRAPHKQWTLSTGRSSLILVSTDEPSLGVEDESDSQRTDRHALLRQELPPTRLCVHPARHSDLASRMLTPLARPSSTLQVSILRPPLLSGPLETRSTRMPQV